MRWQGRRESSNIEDGRGSRGGTAAAAGGGGILVLLIGVVLVFFGVLKPGDLLKLQPQNAVPGGAAVQNDGEIETSPQEEQLKSFVGVVLADTEDVWTALFKQQLNAIYQQPKLRLFRDSVDSACGTASSAVGPFYCPGDHKVYLDLGFFSQLQSQFGATGDFAMAYVVAHEVGHHVQSLLGISDQVSALQRQADEVEANHLSVRLELQADLLAGIWAHHAERSKKILESGDIGEALNAARKIGDDNIQKKSRGYVVKDAFTHGSSAQREKWFKRGIDRGDLSDIKLLFDLPYDQL